MAQLRGRDEVRRRRDRLGAAVSLIDGNDLNTELLAHYARYIAVLMSGYVEQGVKELIREYARKRGDARLQRFVGKQLDRVNGIDTERLKQLLDALDPSWWSQLETQHADELEAVKSVVTLRNNVSHGGDSGVTVATVRGYLDRVDPVMRWLVERLDPAPRA